MSPQAQLILDQVRRDAERIGARVFQVREKTPSMLGSPYAGNHVVAFPQEEYAIGDDVVFKWGKDSSVLHRVEAVKPGFVFTKGTFNQGGDGWIPVADVYGKVKQVVRTRDK